MTDETTLDAIAQRLGDAGIDVRPDELFPGYRRFYVDDCFDDRLEFTAEKSTKTSDRPVSDGERSLPVEAGPH